MIRIPPRPPCIPPPPSFPAIARRGYSPLAAGRVRREARERGGTKFSCTLVAHMWHFAYLCRRNTTSLGKRAIALPPTLSPPTSHAPRNTAAAPAQPTRLRASPPGHTSASKRAQACPPQAKACGRGGEGAPAGRHTGRRTGRKVIAFRERGLGWRRKARCGMPPRGEGGAAKGTAGQGQTKRGAAGAAPLHTGTGTPARSCPERPQAATLSPNRASETLAACLTAFLRPSRPFRPANLHGGKTETPWALTTDWG